MYFPIVHTRKVTPEFGAHHKPPLELIQWLSRLPFWYTFAKEPHFPKCFRLDCFVSCLPILHMLPHDWKVSFNISPPCLYLPHFNSSKLIAFFKKKKKAIAKAQQQKVTAWLVILSTSNSEKVAAKIALFIDSWIPRVNNWCFLCFWHFFYILPHLFLKTALWDRCYYGNHFIDKEMEIGRD